MLALHIQGALAEVVVADLSGVLDQWIEVSDDYKRIRGDIVPGMSVRSTLHRDGGLGLHPEDLSTSSYTLVRLSDDAADIAGWLYGSEGKLPQYWPGPNPERPFFLVPGRCPPLRPGMAPVPGRDPVLLVPVLPYSCKVALAQSAEREALLEKARAAGFPMIRLSVAEHLPGTESAWSRFTSLGLSVEHYQVACVVLEQQGGAS